MARFNPRTGEWEDLAPPSLPRNTTSRTTPPPPPPPPRNTSAYADFERQRREAARRTNQMVTDALYRVTRSPWEKFCDGVADIGNWLAAFAETVRDKLSTILPWVFIAIGVVVLLDLAFVEGHWIMAIIVGLLVGSIYFYAAVIGGLIISWLIYLPIAALRFVFYNVWTLFFALSLLLYVGISAAIDSPHSSYDYSEAPVEQIDENVTELYFCTARVLNVRSTPSTSGEVIGVLQQGESVLVYDLYYSGEFAQIDFNGRRGYVSRNYISDEYPN